MSNEEFYDVKIAPKLAELAKLCQDRKMSFLCSVEFDPENGGRGRTEVQMPDTAATLSAAQRLVHWAARCDGNIDRLFLTCDRHGHEHGHSSVYLYRLGNKNTKSSGNEFAAITVTTKPNE